MLKTLLVFLLILYFVEMVFLHLSVACCGHGVLSSTDDAGEQLK
jgi:hypothetical protein